VCDGFGLEAGGDQFLIETEAFYPSLQVGGCLATLVGYSKDAGFTGYVSGTTVQQAGGILDVDIVDDAAEGIGPNPTAAADPVLFLGGCDDMGLGPYTGDGDGGMNYAFPIGGQTVASVVAAQAVAGGPLVGVVTAVYPWTSGVLTPKSGMFYIQDPVPSGGTPAPGSGVLVYMGKNDIGSNAVPNRGDVVILSGFVWSPYNGTNRTVDLPGYTNDQVQIGSTASATVTVIGNAPLPPPVSLTPADLSPTGTSEKQYYQMRVTVSGGPFTVDGANTSCPVPVESTVAE
jgi:hypothetical protein